MDASTHPVVKKGLAAAKLNSMNEYRREYEEDKDLIYSAFKKMCANTIWKISIFGPKIF